MSDRDALRVEFRRWSASQLDSFLRERGVALDDDASLETKIERACEEESRGDVEGERGLEEDEVDPLDAFMADLETTTTTTTKSTGTRRARGNVVERRETRRPSSITRRCRTMRSRG